MINSKEADLLVTTGISIVFVGDICQVNPVNEEASKVFKFNFFDRVELTVNQRSSNSNVTEIINHYRQNVKIGYLQEISTNNSSKITERDAFDELLFESFKNLESTIFLAWTNVRVSEYNKKIRENLFGTTNEFEEGERIVFNEYYRGNTRNFYTSDVFRVDSCKKVKLNVFCPRCICKSQFVPFEEIVNDYDCDAKKIERCDKCSTPTSTEDHKKQIS